jgi:hypothetical protein
MDVGRPSGSLCSNCMSSPCNVGVTPSGQPFAGKGSVCSTAWMSDAGESPAKGREPVSISKSVTPSAHKSAR